MSETPLTDAEQRRYMNGIAEYVVSADLARTLETRLRQAEADLVKAMTLAAGFMSESNHKLFCDAIRAMKGNTEPNSRMERATPRYVKGE